MRFTRSMYARWSRSVASTPTSSACSTKRCTGLSGSGPTKFSIGFKRPQFFVVLARTGPGVTAGVFLLREILLRELGQPGLGQPRSHRKRREYLQQNDD